MIRVFLSSEKIRNDYDLIKQHIDHRYYSKYFIFSFLVNKSIAAFHYCIYGWKNGYNPNKDFHCAYYLEKYQDVKTSNINPFAHYLNFGAKEKRHINFQTEQEYYEIAPVLTFKCSFISKALINLLIPSNQAKLFCSYFDVKEYRQHIRYWKFTFFPSLLRIHYLLKGSKLNIAPSKIYDPLNSPFKGSFLELLQALKHRKAPGLKITSSYDVWIAKHEGSKESITEFPSLTHQPLISVIIPVYNAAVNYLEEAIASVKNQSYAHWEICIADDCSTDRELIAYLQQISKEEKINVHFRESNGHISACSNSALSLAKGEFVALVDQDDLLAEHALMEVANALNNNPNLKLIYSNEDKINEFGNRFDPYFKPSWNYHLLLSQNYVSHLGVYKKSIVDQIGGFREGYEGSQDYDLLLRFIENIEENEIAHIDKFLYHWRALKGSTAFNIAEKSYALKAGVRALQDHLDRTNQNALATYASLENYYRVKRECSTTPLVSIVIPTRNHLDDLRKAVDSVLHNNRYQNFELLIVDNDSDDPSTLNFLDQISKNEKVEVLSYPGEFNFSAINNYGVDESNGELILMLNNDIEAIDDQWLEEMVSQIQPAQVGIVGAKLLYPDDTVQHAGVKIGYGGVAGHIYSRLHKDAPGQFGRLQLIQNYDAVTAACLLIKKEVYKTVGGLDETNLKVAFNDVDLCLKVIKQGYKIVYTPYAQLYHFESKSRGSDLTEEKRARFNSEVEFMVNKWKIKSTNDFELNA